VAIAVILFLMLIRLLVAEPVRVKENSMSPTLHSGDVLVIDSVTYRFRAPQRGEIVTTHDPLTGTAIVKRVVAVGGDSIGIENGVLVRDGVAVVEPYADLDQMDGYYWGPIAVPEGTVFLLGDHRFRSTDSRVFGVVPVDDIDGRYAGRIWPF
jgi:signal peptidase I